jgi:hypothetical protein
MCKKNRLAKFIVISPETPESQQNLNLVKDANGILLESNALGIVVQVKASIGESIGLPELIHVEEVLA